MTKHLRGLRYELGNLFLGLLNIMISLYTYSDFISQESQNLAINKADQLFSDGIWCDTVPKYQTWPNLYDYKEFDVFCQTFLNSCFEYDSSYKTNSTFKMWCYLSVSDENNDTYPLWHKHGESGLTGIYYLHNPEKSLTEFQAQETIEYKPFSWYIFPSNLIHRPPPYSPSKRYTLSADIRRLIN